MKSSTLYPPEKQSKAQLTTSGQRVLYVFYLFLCFTTLAILLDSSNGPTPSQIVTFDPVKWFKNEFPIIVDDALIKYEMARIDLDSQAANAQVCPQQPAYKPSDSQVKVDIPSGDLLAERLSQAIQVS